MIRPLLRGSARALAIALIAAGHLPTPAQDILSTWRAGRAPVTLEAYERVLSDFARWLCTATAQYIDFVNAKYSVFRSIHH